MKAIEQAKQDVGLPASFQIRYQGAALAFQASLSNELFLILAAIVTMCIVLGVLYKSFIHPITILSTLPSAGVGALLSLMITGHDLDIIGIVLLIWCRFDCPVGGGPREPEGGGVEPYEGAVRKSEKGL